MMGSFNKSAPLVPSGHSPRKRGKISDGANVMSSPVYGGGGPEGSGGGGGFKLNRRATSQAKRLRRTMTKAETVLWTALRGRAVRGYKFRRQHPIQQYIADFACIEAKLIVEVDGATHCTDAQLERDRERTSVLNAEGWLVLHVSNLDIYQDIDGVVRGIEAGLSPLASSRHSPRERGETSDGTTAMSSPACGGGGPEGSGGGNRVEGS